MMDANAMPPRSPSSRIVVESRCLKLKRNEHVLAEIEIAERWYRTVELNRWTIVEVEVLVMSPIDAPRRDLSIGGLDDLKRP